MERDNYFCKNREIIKKQLEQFYVVFLKFVNYQQVKAFTDDL